MLLLVFDVGGGADPDGYLACGVSVWQRPDCVPTEGAVEAAKPVFEGVLGFGLRRVCPGLPGALGVIGVHERQPVPAVVRLPRAAGVFRAAAVEVGRRPIRRRCPHDVRDRLGDALRFVTAERAPVRQRLGGDVERRIGSRRGGHVTSVGPYLRGTARVLSHF